MSFQMGGRAFNSSTYDEILFWVQGQAHQKKYPMQLLQQCVRLFHLFHPVDGLRFIFQSFASKWSIKELPERQQPNF